jgi:hypothetical protein
LSFTARQIDQDHIGVFLDPVEDDSLPSGEMSKLRVAKPGLNEVNWRRWPVSMLIR